MPAALIHDLLARDATEQLDALTARRVSAVELLEGAVDRGAATQGAINAVVAQDVDRAMIQARAIDDARVRGEAQVGERQEAASAGGGCGAPRLALVV